MYVQNNPGLCLCIYNTLLSSWLLAAEIFMHFNLHLYSLIVWICFLDQQEDTTGADFQMR